MIGYLLEYKSKEVVLTRHSIQIFTCNTTFVQKAFRMEIHNVFFL